MHLPMFRQSLKPDDSHLFDIYREFDTSLILFLPIRLAFFLVPKNMHKEPLRILQMEDTVSDVGQSLSKFPDLSTLQIQTTLL